MAEPDETAERPRSIDLHEQWLSRFAAIVLSTTMLLILAAVIGWRFYSRWQTGQLIVTTDGAPLTIEVLSESGDEPVGEPSESGTRFVVPLPAGEYRLRLTGDGALSQSYRLGMSRGETVTRKVALDENRLLGPDPISYAKVCEALVLSPGKADLVEWSGATLIRRDGATGKPIWDASRPAKRWGPDRDPISWIRRLSEPGDPQRPGVIVKPARDLDADGTADIVWAFHGTPSLLALSGKDASVLWVYSASHEFTGQAGRDRSVPAGSDHRSMAQGRFLGEPAVADLDGDGTPDLLGTVAYYSDYKQATEAYRALKDVGVILTKRPPGERAVVAVSGRTGRLLWQYSPDGELNDIIREPLDQGASLIRGAGGSPLVAFPCGQHWIALDPATGWPLGQAIDLGFEPIQPVQHADLDGDGAADVLALGTTRNSLVQTLAAFSSASGEPLWTVTIYGGYLPLAATPMPAWPLVADLDGDGRAEVVVPHFGKLPPGIDTIGVRMLDGPTGTERWVRPLSLYANSVDGPTHLIAAPDIDGDGNSDVVAISRCTARDALITVTGTWTERPRVFIDALRSKDGRQLWWSCVDRADQSYRSNDPPQWYGRGLDGQPMLVVPLLKDESVKIRALQGPRDPAHDRGERLVPMVHFLVATTGREEHVFSGLSSPKAADLDGDGLDDLWGAFEGHLRAIRGTTPEIWRALGRFQPAADLDGDGVTDVVSADLVPPAGAGDGMTESRTAVARSGRDGRVLWSTPLAAWESALGADPASGYRLVTFPMPSGDLDGDGTADVLVESRMKTARLAAPVPAIPLQALSGRTGQPLWSAGPLPLGPEELGAPLVRSFDVKVLDQSKRAERVLSGPDVVVFHANNSERPATGAPGTVSHETRLARLSGRDGSVVWDIALAAQRIPFRKKYHGGEMHRQFADLNGDGAIDVAVIVDVDAIAGQESYELRAISLSDGTVFWSRPLRASGYPPPALAVADLDGDRAAEVIVKDALPGSVTSGIEVIVLDGGNGHTRWTWRGGDSVDRQLLAEPLCLVGLDGRGQREICLNTGTLTGRRLLMLDSQGNEGSMDDIAASTATPATADLDEDGRDELLFYDGGRLRATRGDFEDLWSRPTGQPIREVHSGGHDRLATVVLSPALGLAGGTGDPIWFGGPADAILDAGVPATLPRLLTQTDSATVCRLAMMTSGRRVSEPTLPNRTNHAPVPVDPRWLRRLPWVNLVDSYATHWVYLELAGLALVNVVLPVLILRLATRKRFWSVRMLLAVPVALALPLGMFRLVDSPDFFPGAGQSAGGSAGLAALFLALASLLGVPLLAYLGVAALALHRGQWLRLARLAFVTLLSAVVIGGCWLGIDMRKMAPFEHYSWAGWPLLAWPAALAAGLFVIVGWFMTGVARLAGAHPAQDSRSRPG